MARTRGDYGEVRLGLRDRFVQTVSDNLDVIGLVAAVGISYWASTQGESDDSENPPIWPQLLAFSLYSFGLIIGTLSARISVLNEIPTIFEGNLVLVDEEDFQNRVNADILLRQFSRHEREAAVVATRNSLIVQIALIASLIVFIVKLRPEDIENVDEVDLGLFEFTNPLTGQQTVLSVEALVSLIELVIYRISTARLSMIQEAVAREFRGVRAESDALQQQPQQPAAEGVGPRVEGADQPLLADDQAESKSDEEDNVQEHVEEEQDSVTTLSGGPYSPIMFRGQSDDEPGSLSSSQSSASGVSASVDTDSLEELDATTEHDLDRARQREDNSRQVHGSRR